METMVAQVDSLMDELSFSKALQAIWEVISAGNKYIDEMAPWSLAKDPALEGRLRTVMYCCVEAQRIAHIILSAFMPTTSAKALAYLGFEEKPTENAMKWGLTAGGTTINKAEALFPRIQE